MADTPPLPDATDPPHDATQIDEWLRSRLDHRLTVVLLATSPHHAADAEDVLAAAIAPLSEARLRIERLTTAGAAPAGAVESQPAAPDAVPADAAIERALLKLDALYPDVLLVEQTGADDGVWPRAALRVADRLGLCERAFVALLGVHVTREQARRLGYEDGYPLDTPAAALMSMLAREAVARDELRRHGSSPPCYL